MKRKALVLSLVLALMLTALVPTTILAKDRTPVAPKQLNLTLTPQSIDPPSISDAQWPQADPAEANSWPILDNVNGSPTIVGWVVDSRTIYGAVSGGATGQFTFTYGGILDTLQSGSIQGIVTIGTADGQGMVYLSAQGTTEATIKETYLFGEISGWCGLVGISVGDFFAAFYSYPDLAGLDDAYLEAMYGDSLPLLPKTLGASFSGTAIVESGTGTYAAIHGTASFKPAANQPIILSVYPNQHVYNISGAIQLSGFRAIGRTRLPQLDLSKVKDNVKNWLKDKENKDK